MAFSDPVHMAKLRSELAPAPLRMLEESGPHYPHHLHLDQDDLARLDKDTELEVGEEITLLVRAKVADVHKRKDGDSVHLEITHICTEEPDGDEDDREWYGGGEAEEGPTRKEAVSY